MHDIKQDLLFRLCLLALDDEIRKLFRPEEGETDHEIARTLIDYISLQLKLDDRGFSRAPVDTQPSL